ncbi:MAG: P-loop NTPase fold protein [Promethearchaeota archaeon]
MDKYLETLSEKTPFDSFVSKRFKREIFDIPDARNSLDKEVMDIIEYMKKHDENHIIPLISDAGLGKTHFFWVLHNSINPKNPNFYISYISPQDTKIDDIYFDLCSNILADLGEQSLKLIASNIINIAGGKTINLDLLGLIQIKKSPRTIIKQIFHKIGPDLSEFEQNLIKVFIYLGSGTTFERDIALKWLKKQSLTAKELKKLDIKTNDFTEKEYEEIFKLITTYIGKPLILFFDDIEYYQLLEKERELAELIHNIYEDLNSVLIIMTSLSSSWSYFKNIFETILKKDLKTIKSLKTFSEKNIQSYYKKAMAEYWKKNNLQPPPDPLFPLNDKILKIIHLKSGGNPRLVKKLIKESIEQELYEIQVENLWELKEMM